MNQIVSIIVPAYNERPYLKRCVESILYQTYRNIEIILVDDGSNDGTNELCDQLKYNDSRIKVIHKLNGGLSSARNAGLKIATGDYITFIDSDDYVDSDYIEYLLKAANNTGMPVIQCNYRRTYEDGNSNFQQYKEIILHGQNEILRSLLVTFELNTMAWAKLYKSSIFRQTRFMEGRNNEDTIFLTDILPIISGVAVFPEVKYSYFMKNESIMRGQISSKKVTDAFFSCEYLLNYCDRWENDLTVYVKRNLCKIAISLYCQCNKNTDKKIIKYIQEKFNDNYNQIKGASSELEKKDMILFRAFYICPRVSKFANYIRSRVKK